MRARLLAYWRRQVLVEAAAEAYPPCSSNKGPPHVRMTLPNQVWSLGTCPCESCNVIANAHCRVSDATQTACNKAVLTQFTPKPHELALGSALQWKVSKGAVLQPHVMVSWLALTLLSRGQPGTIKTQTSKAGSHCKPRH